MPRPTLLVAEPEPEQALSVRKLVLETAKFNVLTAHSTREALDLFALFPNVSIVILVSGVGIDCEGVARTIKRNTHKVKVIFLTPRIGGMCNDADHNISSMEPETLVDVVRSLVGDPRTMDKTPGSESSARSKRSRSKPKRRRSSK